MAAEEAHLGDATATASPKPKNPAVDGVAMAAPAGGHGRGPGNKLSLVPLIFLIFFEVAGGPYGAEPAVQSAGPLFALLGFLIFPFIWAVPESLVTAELSTAMPGNGGFVLWADRAFGPFSGSLMGTWKYVSGAINGAAFPALCADYVARVAPAVSGGGSRVATIVAFNVAISVLNYTGLSIVGWTAVALGVASLSPFALMFGAALPKIRPHRWRATAVDKDWKLFFNTLFWNLNYWDSASTMAGEVERPGKTFPRALLSAVAMTTLGYLLPLMAATGAIDAAPRGLGERLLRRRRRHDRRAVAQVLDRGGRRALHHRPLLGDAEQRRVPAPRHGGPGPPPPGLRPPRAGVRHALGRHPRHRRHHPRHVLLQLQHHRRLGKLPLQPRHAARVRRLRPPPRQARRHAPALRRAAPGSPGRRRALRRPLGVPRLRHGHRRLEGVRHQRRLHRRRRGGLLPHGPLQGQRVAQVQRRRRRPRRRRDDVPASGEHGERGLMRIVVDAIDFGVASCICSDVRLSVCSAFLCRRAYRN